MCALLYICEFSFMETVNHSAFKKCSIESRAHVVGNINYKYYDLSDWIPKALSIDLKMTPMTLFLNKYIFKILFMT